MYSVLYLGVSVEGGVVQGSSPTTVRHVYTAQQGDDELSTTQSLISSCHMKRRLPVLVTCVHVGRVTDQHTHCLLKTKAVVWRRNGAKFETWRAHSDVSFIKSIAYSHTSGKEIAYRCSYSKKLVRMIILSFQGTAKLCMSNCGMHITSHAAGYETETGRNWCCSYQC